MMAYINLDQLRQWLSTPATRPIVFVSIDFEYKCTNKDLTEVGLSILDTANVVIPETPTSPLEYAAAFAEHIKSHHLRVAEHHLWINTFPLGSDPAGFSPEFGKSKKVPARYLVERMRSIMWRTGWKREYVLVGCALENERGTLERLGFNLASFTYEVDIQQEDRSIRHDNHHGSLGKICGKLGLAAQNIHNAGNDARYTLECMLRQVAMTPAQQAQYAQGPTSSVNWEKSDSAAFNPEMLIGSVREPLMILDQTC